jgi:hypothetical protein
MVNSAFCINIFLAVYGSIEIINMLENNSTFELKLF